MTSENDLGLLVASSKPTVTTVTHSYPQKYPHLPIVTHSYPHPQLPRVTHSYLQLPKVFLEMLPKAT